jgi:hypothetical protein
VAVWVTEKIDVFFVQAELGQTLNRFALTHQAIGLTIVIPIGHHDHGHVFTRLARAQDQTRGEQGFVVGMGCEHD